MTAPDRLGGRLALLSTSELDDEQRVLHRQLEELVGPESRRDGYTAQLADGRFVGPFNAMLRVPTLTAGLGSWVRAIGSADIAEDVRQVVILTVAATWRAEYEIDAHVSAARVAGVPQDAIDAILGGAHPTGLRPDVGVAHELAHGLLRSHDVPEDVYQRCTRLFGEEGLIAILSLIGQYQLVSSLLVCFRVPAAPPPSQPDVHR